jgi:hypothetical protein
MEDRLDASIVPKAACFTETRIGGHVYLPDQSSAAATPRMSRRASALVALVLSLGLWAAIGAALISLVSVVHG